MTWTVHQAELIQWLKDYEGPRFHACLGDPPYCLISISERFGKKDSAPARTEGNDGSFSRLSRGFMSQTWDGWPDLPSYQRWVTEWGSALLGIVHPGALGMFFGGTRTSHRLACGLEDAGWNVVDTLMWMHGCLSDDTEAFIEGEWRPYHEILPGERALCYDPAKDAYSWRPVQRVLVYPYRDAAYHVLSDTTDQIVTKNHRVVVESGGTFVFREAEVLALEREARVPILEDLPSLLSTLPLREPYPSEAERSVWNGVFRCMDSSGAPTTGGELSGLFGETETEDRGGVRHVRSTPDAPPMSCEEGPRELLFPPLRGDETRRGSHQALPQGAGCVDSGEFEVLSREDVGAAQSCVEGRRDLSTAARKLRLGEIRPLPAGVRLDGEDGWLRNGASPRSGESDWTTAVKNGVRPSLESRPIGQSASEPRPVPIEQGSQTLRASRATSTTLARILPTFYSGVVWCLTVPTGAFVARRRGKIFVTGNSGFPKAHDVSKAIDKAAGEERTPTGRPKPGHEDFADATKHSLNLGWDRPWAHDPEKVRAYHMETEPTTEAAKAWKGWKTPSLKPSYEPVILVIAPRQGHTYADLALKFRTGALNIDGGRIGVGGKRPLRINNGEPDERGFGNKGSGISEGNTSAGRYPANVLLSHSEGCVLKGTKKVAGHKGYPNGPGGKSINYSSDKRSAEVRPSPWPGYADADGMEETEDWACVPDCPIRMLDEQAGESSPGHWPNGSVTGYGELGGGTRSYGGQGPKEAGGNVSRFFYCSKADRFEREAGLDDLPEQRFGQGNAAQARIERGESNPENVSMGYNSIKTIRNSHPTIKSLSITKYLATLLLPPKIAAPRRLLVPFSGAGSEMIGALLAGWDEVTGIERDAHYSEIARARIPWWIAHPDGEQSAPEVRASKEKGKSTALDKWGLI